MISHWLVPRWVLQHGRQRPWIAYGLRKGNDRVPRVPSRGRKRPHTPAPQHRFPGLVAGDQWCVCAASWRQAFKQGVACPVHLESTHRKALELVQLEVMALAIAPEV